MSLDLFTHIADPYSHILAPQAYSRQNRPSPGQNRQNRQGNILLYISNSNSNRANYGKMCLLFSLYISLTDVGLFLLTLWHVHAMVFVMSFHDSEGMEKT